MSKNSLHAYFFERTLNKEFENRGAQMEMELRTRVWKLFGERGGGKDLASKKMFDDSWAFFLLWKKRRTEADGEDILERSWPTFSEEEKEAVLNDLVRFLFYNTPLFH